MRKISNAKIIQVGNDILQQLITWITSSIKRILANFDLIPLPTVQANQSLIEDIDEINPLQIFEAFETSLISLQSNTITCIFFKYFSLTISLQTP